MKSNKKACKENENPLPKKDSKKVVLVIVEGSSDKTLLETSLSEFFEEKYGSKTVVKFPMLDGDGYNGGDITTLNGSTPEKIEMLINKFIIFPELESYGLYPRHVLEIIHIIDMDGAFINDDLIIPFTEDESNHSSKNVYYYGDHISARDTAHIQSRNIQKKANIKRLLEYCKQGFPIQKYYDTENRGNRITSKTTVVPYSLYYFSCNMDHFTSDNANVEGSKVALAEQFLLDHGEDCETLNAFITSIDPTVSEMAFDDSWDYIMKEDNSLNRHTNLALLLKDFFGVNE